MSLHPWYGAEEKTEAHAQSHSAGRRGRRAFPSRPTSCERHKHIHAINQSRLERAPS
jgi:hypothetical protein